MKKISEDVYKCKINIKFRRIVEDWAPWKLVVNLELEDLEGEENEREWEIVENIKSKLNCIHNE